MGNLGTRVRNPVSALVVCTVSIFSVAAHLVVLALGNVDSYATFALATLGAWIVASARLEMAIRIRLRGFAVRRGSPLTRPTS